MNLRNLTDDQLEHDLGALVRKEREILSAILHHLLEINRRRLFSKYQCKNLHEYACKKFGYTEDQANLRITAMYLLKDVPQASRQIEDGSISLSNIAQAQVHFRKELKENIRRTSEEKLEILSKIENCSKVEAKQVLADESGTLFKLGGLPVPVSRNEEMPFRPNAQLKLKLKRLKELKPGTSLEELVEQAFDLALKTWDPIEKAKRAVVRKAKKQAHAEKRSAQAPAIIKEKISVLEREKPIEERELRQGRDFEQKENLAPKRYIKVKVRHELQLRDQAACVNCGSKKNLEADHIQDFARGGSNEIENLRLLCRSCNQRHAINSYGLSKMSRYLKSPGLSYH